MIKDHQSMIFRIGRDGEDFEVVHASSGLDGDNPFTSGPIADSAGNLSGATAASGAAVGGPWGSVPLGANGDFEVPYSFTSNDGVLPVGGLVADAVGNLYGSTLRAARRIAERCSGRAWR